MNGNYTTKQIREALTVSFSDEELTDLLFDNFVEVYNNRSDRMSKGAVIQLLLDHCYRANEIPRLVDLIQQERPNAFGDRPSKRIAGGDKFIFQYYRNVFRHGVMAGPYYPCAPKEYQNYHKGLSVIIKAILSGKYVGSGNTSAVEGALIDEIADPERRATIDTIVIPALRNMRKLHEDNGRDVGEKSQSINAERQRILDALNPIWREFGIDELPR